MVESSETSLRVLSDLLRGESPPAGVAWRRVLSMARQYHLSPLLFWRLQAQELPEGLVPETAWNVLRNDYYVAVGRMVSLDWELAQVLKALKQAGVPVLLLKGAALARTVYPNPALRSMQDLDLLVRREHREQARWALEALGYECQPEPPQRFNPFNTGFTGEVSFSHAQGRQSIVVDLHWELFAAELFRRTTALDLQALWARASSLQIGDAIALSLSPEDALAHVCLHLSVQGFTHLRGYADVIQIVESGTINWDVFVGQVRGSRIRVACYFPLWWAAEAWGVPVPDEALQALRPGPVRARLGRWMTVRGAARGPETGHAWDHVAQMLAVDRLRDLVRLLLWLLFPGPTWLRERYRLREAWQAWAWMVVHPFFVLWEGLRSLAALAGQLGSDPSSGRHARVAARAARGRAR